MPLPTEETTLLEINRLSKSYHGVAANEAVSLSISSGEAHALLGENGAGKSTLVKMIFGLVKPDGGRMSLRGVPFEPAAPQQARSNGIAMVFQHFSLFEALSVAENVALGMDAPPNMRDLSLRVEQVSESYGLTLDPHQVVGKLSSGERQRVEVIRCLLQDPALLIMDEPTSVLTPQEVEVLFGALRKLKSEGTSILYISHKLEEIRQLCDRATILRMGKKVGECSPADTSAREMAELMVGSSFKFPKRPDRKFGRVALNIKNLTVSAPSMFGTGLDNVSLTVREGEILGIGGVAGNGQEELQAVLSGEITSKSNAVNLGDRKIGQLNPKMRRTLGLLTAPEDRLGHAAAPDMNLIENTFLTCSESQNLSRYGFLNWCAATAFAGRIVAEFDVRTDSVERMARSLSGGNLQKFVIGREVLQRPKVLVVSQPTWGVDAAAAAFIRQALLNLTAEGTAVICISQDLDELMEISDNFAALNDGRLTSSRPVVGLTVKEIGLMMGGDERESSKDALLTLELENAEMYRRSSLLAPNDTSQSEALAQ